MNKKYITTAIDYPNGKPHIGHAYEKILADTYRRWYNLLDFNTYLLTGTDENGQKLAISALNNKKPTKDYIDSNIVYFKNLCKDLSIGHDKFIRTTESKHKEKVVEIWDILKEKGFIYKGEYSGDYCYGCESFLTENQQINGKCPNHGELDVKSEEGYFFKLSILKEKILQAYKDNPKLITPENKRKEILKRLEQEDLKDISITRPDLYDWGIKVPDTDLVFYTWFDALINYYSGADNHFSPDLQIIGKDIVWFHGVIWLGILIACEKELPSEIYVHGIITDSDGKKLSKSLGNSIDIDKILNEYPSDVLRYYLLLYKISGKQDGRFSEEELASLYKSDFIQGIGNTYSRISSLIEKKNILYYTDTDEDSVIDFNSLEIKLTKLYEDRSHDLSIECLKQHLNKINKYLTDKKPWSLSDKDSKIILNTALFNFKGLIKYYEPIIPNIASKILDDLNCEIIRFKGHLF